jgi:hypothetical protein
MAEAMYDAAVSGIQPRVFGYMVPHFLFGFLDNQMSTGLKLAFMSPDRQRIERFEMQWGVRRFNPNWVLPITKAIQDTRAATVFGRIYEDPFSNILRMNLERDRTQPLPSNALDWVATVVGEYESSYRDPRPVVYLRRGSISRYEDPTTTIAEYFVGAAGSNSQYIVDTVFPKDIDPEAYVADNLDIRDVTVLRNE